VSRSIALWPQQAVFYSNRATIALEIGELVHAQNDSLRAIGLDPQLPEARVSLGWAQFRSNQNQMAARSFLQVLLFRPSDAVNWMSLSRSLAVSGERFLILGAIRRVCIIDRFNQEAFLELGSATHNLGDSLSAIDPFYRLITLSPAHREGCFRLGCVLRIVRDIERSVRWLRRAVVIEPLSSAASYEIGVSFDQLGDWQLALSSLTRSRILDPSYADCEVSLSSILLRMGRFSEGWRYYRSRWRSESLAQKGVLTPDIDSTRPLFSVSDRSRRVLVWGEQGVGDDVMFGGLVGEFRGLCGELLLQVDRRLMGLFERALPGVRVFERGKTVPAELYDEQIPMGSLGKWLRPSRESFEGKGGRYLQAQEGLGRRLRAQLGVGASEKLIGLSWRSASPVSGNVRSLPLRSFVSRLPSAPYRFVNLQYGEVSEELSALREETGVEVLTHPGIDNREDLEGLAGLIEGCDLVVSVGNATAHLSGALGQKTWVLLPYVAGWRWLHEGERCPWYQSVRLFRQTERDRWQSVLDSIAASLLRI
jgi:tetratricopeptide (TPR) repeat protein